MPVTIRTAEMAYKDGSGQYIGINGVSEQSTADQIAAIEAAGEHVLEDVIPHDWTELTKDFDDIKEKIVMSSTTEPDEANNRIWLKPIDSETAIPTYDEFVNVRDAAYQESLEIANISGSTLPIVKELGSINTNTGKESASTDGTRLRTNYIPCEGSKKYTLKTFLASGITVSSIYFCFYSAENESSFIRATSVIASEEGRSITFDANTKFVRLRANGTGMTIDGVTFELIKDGSKIDECVQPRVFDVPTADFCFAENDDLNDIVTPGRYVCTSLSVAETLANSPFSNSVITLIVMNLSSVSGKMVHICIGSQSTRMAIRIKDDTWDDWNYLATENDLNNYARFNVDRYIRFSADDNLNNFTTPGSYICPSTAVANSLVNNPFPEQIIRLFVSDISASNNTTFQTVICKSTGSIATRSKTGASTWSDWNIYLTGKYDTTLLYGGTGAWNVDGYLNYKGEPISSSGRLCSDYIAVNGGDYLRFVKCTSSPNKMICCFYNSDHIFIGDYYVGSGGSTTFDSVDVLVPSNAAYIRAGIRSTNSSIAYIYKVTINAMERSDTPEIKLLKDFTASVKGKAGAPFINLRTTHTPLFTLIDDDTRNYNQVNDFYTICNDTGIKGTSSVITKYLTEREGVKTRLAAGEREGHQAVLHCYDQDACPNTHWQHPEDYTGYTEIITDNVVQGIQDMISNGFIHWNTWVTPGGTRNPLMYEIARSFGLKCTVSINQNDYLDYDNHWTRWGMPRMELYPNDTDHAEGNTLAGIKANIDKCVSDNGWLIVGIHVFQSADNNSTLFSGSNGWNNEDYSTNGNAHGTDSDLTRFRARFARIYEMINYAKTAGMKCVTLGEGLSYWEPIFRFYETF